MSELFVIDAHKAHRKARDLTYEDLAKGLELSEISIKRLFANADSSLEHLEPICTYLQTECADLFRSSPQKRKLISSLTYQQEVNVQGTKVC